MRKIGKKRPWFRYRCQEFNMQGDPYDSALTCRTLAQARETARGHLSGDNSVSAVEIQDKNYSRRAIEVWERCGPEWDAKVLELGLV